MRVKLQEIKVQLCGRMHDATPKRGDVEGGGHGILRISRGALELAGTACVPISRHGTLAAHASATQSEGRSDLGSHDEDRGCMAAVCCPESFIHGQASDLPSNTRGRSPVRELRTLGAVRWAPGNGRPYRDQSRLAAWESPSSPDLNFSNRPVWTHMPGGVGGDRPATVAPIPIAPCSPSRIEARALAGTYSASPESAIANPARPPHAAPGRHAA